MPEKIVKYKLEPLGNGYVAQAEIYKGGEVWTNSSDLDELILVGKINIANTAPLPEYVIEVITQAQLDAHNNVLSDESLSDYKAKKYTTVTDPLFAEAIREKLEGREEKWNEYIAKSKEIYDLAEIPAEEI